MIISVNRRCARSKTYYLFRFVNSVFVAHFNRAVKQSSLSRKTVAGDNYLTALPL